MNTETKVITGATATTGATVTTHESDIHTAIMDVITDVWDRAKQINEAAYEILDLIEADRKKLGRNDNDKWNDGDREGNENDNRKRRDEPVGYIPLSDERIRLIWKETRARMGDGGDPVLWFARAIERAHGISAPQPLSESDIPDEPDLVRCAECGAEMIQVRPGKWQHPDCSQSSWAAEMVSKTDWNNELSSWSDEDFIRIFPERPDLADRLRKVLAEPGGYVHTVPDDCETLHWRGQILSLNELAAISAEPVKVPIDDLAHEIWAVAQTAPGEGIADAVERIVALLARYR